MWSSLGRWSEVPTFFVQMCIWVLVELDLMGVTDLWQHVNSFIRQVTETYFGWMVASMQHKKGYWSLLFASLLYPFVTKVDIILDTVLSGLFTPPDLGCFTIAMDCQFLWISKQNVHSTKWKSQRMAMGFLHHENNGSVIGAKKL